MGQCIATGDKEVLKHSRLRSKNPTSQSAPHSPSNGTHTNRVDASDNSSYNEHPGSVSPIDSNSIIHVDQDQTESNQDMWNHLHSYHYHITYISSSSSSSSPVPIKHNSNNQCIHNNHNNNIPNHCQNLNPNHLYINPHRHSPSSPLREEHIAQMKLAHSSPKTPSDVPSWPWHLNTSSSISDSNMSPRSLGSVSTRTTMSAVKSVSPSGKRLVNQYGVLETIDQGNYGKVKLVESEDDGRLYAMKVYRRTRFFRGDQTRTQKDSFRQEIAILKKISHPNIVRLHEVIDDPTKDKLYMILEYVEQGPVMKLNEDGVAENGPIDLDQVRQYLEDILSGLQFLHGHQIVHRDIKPDNLLVDQHGKLKLSDFGVSRVLDDDNLLQGSEGTPAFWAPEECREDDFDGPSADIWAVGVTLYALGFGRLPFSGDTLFEMFNDITQAKPSFPENADPLFVDLLSSILKEDPEERLSLEGIMQHRWFNQGRDRTHQFIPGVSLTKTITQEEVDNAISGRKPVFSNLIEDESQEKNSELSDNTGFDLSSIDGSPYDPHASDPQDLNHLIENLPGTPTQHV
eukprot:gb/GECH01003199.1/.p1 GENE.gb/GECH01003199.1/~~gb/GECH01003199.1/.p1  ORF type:complete len:571 (+),score=141.06 gb/GECH01003199.1/:1-1713(+)